MARRRRDPRRGTGPSGAAAGAGAGRRPRRDGRRGTAAPAESLPRATADRPPREEARQEAVPAEPTARATDNQPPGAPTEPAAAGRPSRRDPPREAAAPAGGGAAVAGSRPHRRRWLIWTTAAAVAVAVASAGISQARRAAYAARLPALPELSGQPAPLREHLETANRGARDRPTSADAVGALGLAYHADLFLDHADRAYALAEALSGGAWRWTYYRALAHGTRGNTPGLAAGLRQVVAAAPDFGPAWWRLGEAEFKAGRYDRAAEAWRRARRLGEPAPATDVAAPPERGAPAPAAERAPRAPVSAYAGLGLARVALVQGDAEGAAGLLEEVTAGAPGFGPAFRLLGDAYSTLDRVEDAARAIRTADRLPQFEPYPDRLSEALVRESRSTTFLLQQAATADLTTNAAWREHLIRRALESDPDHPVALAELATTFRLLRRYEEALELLERQRRQRPDDFGVLADIGRCLSGLQRYREAEEVLRRALEGLDNAPTRYELGVVLDRAGRLSDAIAEYRRALDHNPNHLEALNNLGVALAGQGRMDEAARRFERVLAVDPENADAHANLGLALAAAGARDDAASAFREALRLDPDHAGARGGLEDIGAR